MSVKTPPTQPRRASLTLQGARVRIEYERDGKIALVRVTNGKYTKHEYEGSRAALAQLRLQAKGHRDTADWLDQIVDRATRRGRPAAPPEAE